MTVIERFIHIASSIDSTNITGSDGDLKHIAIRINMAAIDSAAVQAVLIGFIPMLMGTGGNSGAQASTAVIRSISLGDTEPEDVGRVIWKEFRVAILCGVTLAAVNFAKMLLVDRMLLNNDGVTITVAAVVSLSIVLIVMFAKVVGSVLPIAAEKLGVDPAVMANPLISTITDAVSLLIYFEIAKLMISF